MRKFLIVGGLFLMVLAAASTPASIVYALYLWGGEGVDISAAAWSGAKFWVGAFLCVIPGSIMYVAGSIRRR